jgi:hypothetical protein
LNYLATFILFVIGCFIGLKFPDFDNAFRWHPLLLHRSILTHSFLIPLLFACSFGAFRKTAQTTTRWFILGLCAATAVHLCFDLFVNRWMGFSLLHIPFFGRTTPLLSFACFAISAFVCLFISCRLLRNPRELLLLIGGTAVCYGTCAARQPYLSFWALVALVITGFLSLVIARPSYRNEADVLVRKYLDQ